MFFSKPQIFLPAACFAVILPFFFILASYLLHTELQERASFILTPSVVHTLQLSEKECDHHLLLINSVSNRNTNPEPLDICYDALVSIGFYAHTRENGTQHQCFYNPVNYDDVTIDNRPSRIPLELLRLSFSDLVL